MRFMNVPKYTFTDSNGASYNLYERRTIPEYQVAKVLPKLEEDVFDEIFTRPEIAGDGMEGASFQLHEANMAEILDAKFDYTKLRTVKVPVLNDLG